MKIKVLADTVINQISAGEVVERPSSVVRELVDNSIDAGASDILVRIENGGQTLISVSDDGCGMARDDALLAFERHATSKVHSIEDLGSIATLGFRGEALPSIASVSRVVLRTRRAADDSGTEVTIAGGKVSSVAQCSTPFGTCIEVRDLFFNTPARRKFLKSARTEEQKIKMWLMHSAIAHPKVRYRLSCDDREILNLGRKSSSIERAQTYFKGSVVEVEGGGAEVRVQGLVAHPSLAQFNPGALVILVNGRLVSDRMILKAAHEGFCSTLKDREYPVGFISLQVNPETVDVNVHPQKSEIRFRAPQEIFLAVRSAVKGAVAQFSSAMPAQMMEASSRSSFGKSVALDFSGQDTPKGEFVPHSLGANIGATQAYAVAARKNSSVAEDRFSNQIQNQSEFKFSLLHYRGQLFSCYLLCELDGEFYIVDMHAAHERYNYNLIRNSYRNKNISSQKLLIPLELTLPQEGVQNCVDNRDLFTGFGFDIDESGLTGIIIRAIPALLSERRVVELVKEIAAISPDEFPEGKFTEKIDHIAARLACHASIRSGLILSEPEVAALFEALDSTEFSAACPHGRPVVVSFSEQEVERWFGRDR